MVEEAKEKIRLLMEEADCDEGQAELALQAVKYDLGKAIRNIGSLLRDFVVLKGKFHHVSSNLSGLFVVLINVKTNRVVRIHTVISYNPVLFETDLSLKWVNFEKQIFAHRLQGGVVRNLSQEIEQVLYHNFSRPEAGIDKAVWKDGDMAGISRIFGSLIQGHMDAVFPATEGEGPKEMRLLFEREEINLIQFRHMENIRVDTDRPARQEDGDPAHHSDDLFLTVSLTEDPDGQLAAELNEGVVIQSLISDERDIAQYLGRLMGGKSGDAHLPLPSAITRIEEKDGQVEVRTELAPNIIGIARIPRERRLKVLYQEDEDRWYQLFPW